MLSNEQKVQECDANSGAGSSADWSQKIQYNTGEMPAGLPIVARATNLVAEPSTDETNF